MKKLSCNSRPCIRREPIILNPHAIANIHIFKKFDDLDDIWESELGGAMWPEDYARSAKQFVEQIKGECCMLFMEALRDEVIKAIKEHKKWVKDTTK